MNLDSLSFALAEISYLVANLTKKNFRSSVAEINHVSYVVCIETCIYEQLSLPEITVALT